VGVALALAVADFACAFPAAGMTEFKIVGTV
jgi:hypothetical protein